ncbi:hypothetical protein [Paracoccus sp. S1E-3]|uniref:hypothetical protein n=1 Tax=Paracoccus sp. S1E-3 TaxID=2756130 RepID=UPI0015EEBCA7|nr:hypothetical protein [Paracoccus sp. S1E-3]MBA4489577.1 hypothetical protein [Paracoccus sp. S1E-3]
MPKLDHNGPALAAIQGSANATKLYAYFTGYLEGLAIDDQIIEAISRIAGDSFAATGLPEISASVGVEEWIIADPRTLDRANFVLTGTFAIAPRSRLSTALQALGMIERGTVNWKTDYLVIGGKPSRDWLEPNRGGKIKQAIFYREHGAPIRFVTEAQIRSILDRTASGI